MGKLMRGIYDYLTTLGPEPEKISYYALAIIVTTIVFKIILLPLNIKQTRATKKMSEMQPKFQEIQKKYKDPQSQQMKMQELYREEKFNPAMGCILPLIQIPILLAFFRVFREPIKYAFQEPGMYESMNKTFFWIKNLDNPDPLIYGLPLLAGITTFLHSKIVMPKQQGMDDKAQSTQQTMTMMLPVMIFISARSFPAGLALYWVANNIINIIQQLITNKIID